MRTATIVVILTTAWFGGVRATQAQPASVPVDLSQPPAREPVDIGGVPTALEELLAYAERHAPAIAVATAELQLAQADAGAAAPLLPDNAAVQISLGQRRAVAGGTGLDAQLQLLQPIEIGGQRRQRRGVAALSRASRERALDRTRWELHQQLHGIPAPHWLARHAPLEGDRLLHGDLHPLNVLMTDEGPMVIDWSNASRGAPAFDVADAWSLFACADPPDIPVAALVVPVGRRLFLRGFLDGVDRAAAARAMPAVVRERMSDPNISDTEKRRMKRLAAGLTGS